MSSKSPQFDLRGLNSDFKLVRANGPPCRRILRIVSERKQAPYRSGKCDWVKALSTLAGLRQRACRIFRKVENGKMSHEVGRSLIWQLSMIRPMLEAESLERIEAKLLVATRQQISAFSRRIDELALMLRPTESLPQCPVIVLALNAAHGNSANEKELIASFLERSARRREKVKFSVDLSFDDDASATASTK